MPSFGLVSVTKRRALPPVPFATGSVVMGVIYVDGRCIG
jgi:hypothetical protein